MSLTHFSQPMIAVRDCESLKSWAKAFILGVTVLCATVGMTVMDVADNQPIAVVFSPFSDPMSNWRRVALVEGAVIRETFGGTILIVSAEKMSDRAFRAALRRVGAWAIVNPQMVGGCGFSRVTLSSLNDL
ncbi:hypothetical protein CCP2SC5_390024 [Azospirillaceae bacterium]